MFVGDFNKGNIHHIDLNKDRTKLSLGNVLKDKLNEIIFAESFGEVTDIEIGPDGYPYEIGPDGYPYVVSIHLRAIYRIVPNNTIIQTSFSNTLIAFTTTLD